MLIHATLLSILFLFFIEKNIFKIVKFERSSLLLAFSFVLYSFFLPTQLTRQFFSSIFILFALFNGNRKFLYITLATVFHLTALPLYLIITLIKNKPWTGIPIVLAFTAISHFFYDYLNFINLLGSGFSQKLSYYDESSSSNLDAEISTVRYIGFFVILNLFIYLISIFQRKKNDAGTLLYFGIIVVFLYISIINIPLLSFRLLLIFHAIALGLYVTKVTSLLHLRPTQLLALLILIWKFNLILPTEKGEYWMAYPYFNLHPFYYIFN